MIWIQKEIYQKYINPLRYPSSKKIVISHKQKPGFMEKSYPIWENKWPEYTFHTEAGEKYWFLIHKIYPEYQNYLCDERENIIGISNTIPLYWDGNNDTLPGGWEQAIQQSVYEYNNKIAPNTLCGLAATIAPDFEGQGISYELLKIKKNIVKKNNLQFFIVPVRPNQKKDFPLIPMEKYMYCKRYDDLPIDAWLRAHVKSGAKIIKNCENSIIIKSSIKNWQKWTNIIFPCNGDYIIPGGLAPLKVDLENNVGIYSESNVWVTYDI